MSAPFRQRLVTGLPLAELMLLVGAAVLFLAALFSDLAYSSSYQIQWSNFAAWLTAGAMVFAGLALAWAIVDAIIGPGRRGRPLLVLLILAALFVLGLINSFIHARDAWGMMPTGLILSVIVSVLAFCGLWVGLSRIRVAVAP